MAEVDLEVEGLNGWMGLRGDCVTIRRKLFHGKNKGTKSIDLKSITALQWKDGGVLMQGFLQIVFSGSHESKGGRGDAWQDENTISFMKAQQRAFEELRVRIDRARRGAQANRPPAAVSLADELSKLAALREAGHLDDAEFVAMKAKLIG